MAEARFGTVKIQTSSMIPEQPTVTTPTWPGPVPGIQGGSSFDSKPEGGTSHFALGTTSACQEAID